jgi:hypothetical protein
MPGKASYAEENRSCRHSLCICPSRLARTSEASANKKCGHIGPHHEHYELKGYIRVMQKSVERLFRNMAFISGGIQQLCQFTFVGHLDDNHPSVAVWVVIDVFRRVLKGPVDF